MSTTTNAKPNLATISSWAKRRGYIYPSSEIYGGFESTYDYGHYGTLLKNNIRDYWWRKFVLTREDIVGLDSSIILNPQTWEASGHVAEFSDPLVDDTISKKRYRADHLVEEWLKKNADKLESAAEIDVDGMGLEELNQFIADHEIKSPDGNPLTPARKFNLLFETKVGVTADSGGTAYMRGETAQGIFVSFKAIMDSMRVKLPFGVAQVGKAFRNEITKGQFVFRTLEFEQMEIEYFFDPETTDWEELFAEWRDLYLKFYQELGIPREDLVLREHSDEERSHYSSQTFDIDYKFDFGTKELFGLAYRGDYDLKQHAKHSGKKLTYRDPQTGREFIPHVIEPAMGLNRALLAMLYSAYAEEETDGGKTRTVLKLKPEFAPIKAAIFPLQKDEKLVATARELFQDLSREFSCEFDNAGNIGKMYRRQDEIGTPICITVDYDGLQDDTVTIRHRDDMSQERVKVSELKTKLREVVYT